MTDLRERIARLIAEKSSWGLYITAFEPAMEIFDSKDELRGIADAILALLPALPPGWVDFVQGVADARNGGGMFWLGLTQDQDVIDRMGDAAVAMLSARPTLSTESGWRDIATAPRGADEFGFTPSILLGFAPDEEGHSLATREGYWRQTNFPGWVTSIDPNVPIPYIQPTHWMPLPTPPTETER